MTEYRRGGQNMDDYDFDRTSFCDRCQRGIFKVHYFCPWCGKKQPHSPTIRQLKDARYYGWNDWGKRL